MIGYISGITTMLFEASAKQLVSLIAIIGIFATLETNSAFAAGEQTRLIFVNARGEDGQSVGYKRIVATREEWNELIKPSIRAQLKEEFGAASYTLGAVSPGQCYVFSRSVDQKKGVKLFLDHEKSLETARARALDLKTRKYYPRTIIETACHDGGPGKKSGTFSCGQSGETVTIRESEAASDVFSLNGSSGRNGNLTLVTQRRKIERLEAELKMLTATDEGLVTAGLEDTPSPKESKIRDLANQLKVASDDYERKFIDGIRDMCPEISLKDPSWLNRAESWTRDWIEQSRNCKFGIHKSDPRSCEYDPTWTTTRDDTGKRG